MKKISCQKPNIHERYAVAALLIIGFALRLAAIGSLPRGLNQDEASAAYDAWALLRYGVDRNGCALPVLFISWGSGQNVLMSYLAMPFIALLGPTALAIRLPNALFGCIALVAFWHTARRAGGSGFGVCALALLALDPWHIMSCRWALESNLFPSLMMLALLFTSLARERAWALLPAAAIFALSVYAYGTAFFFLPIFLVCALVWLGRDLKPLPTAVSAAAFILIALPIALCQLRNIMGADGLRFLGLTLPRLTQTRQADTSLLGGGSVFENLKSLVNMLVRQSDGLIFNALPIMRGGIFYFFGLPAAVYGIVLSLRRRRERRAEGPMRIALAAALVCALLIRGNINRLNMLWLPMVYFSALGIYELLCKLKAKPVLPLAALALCFALFFGTYIKTFGGAGNVNYFPGLTQAIEYAESLDGGRIYITNYVNQPYIFALLASETPPETFCESVEYADPNAAFRRVLRFEGFEFRSESRADISVVCSWETGGRTVLGSFGKFCVCESAK